MEQTPDSPRLCACLPRQIGGSSVSEGVSGRTQQKAPPASRQSKCATAHRSTSQPCFSPGRAARVLIGRAGEGSERGSRTHSHCPSRLPRPCCHSFPRPDHLGLRARGEPMWTTVHQRTLGLNPSSTHARGRAAPPRYPLPYTWLWWAGNLSSGTLAHVPAGTTCSRDRTAIGLFPILQTKTHSRPRSEDVFPPLKLTDYRIDDEESNL